MTYNTWSTTITIMGQGPDDFTLVHKPVGAKMFTVTAEPYCIIIDQHSDVIKFAIGRIVNMVQLRRLASFLETIFIKAEIVTCENLDLLYYADKIIQTHNMSLEDELDSFMETL